MKKPMPKAMVLAAGLGTRMRPLTDHLPKPLVKVAGITLIDRTLDWLASAGVAEAVINSHYHAELLESHLAKRHTPAVRISRETTVLETGGGVKQALPLLLDFPRRSSSSPELRSNSKVIQSSDKDWMALESLQDSGHDGELSGDTPFFVVNSDTICIDGETPALHRLLAAWDDSMDALLLVHKREDAVGFSGPGDFFLGKGGVLRRRLDAPSAPYVFTGMQLMHPRLFRHAPEGAFSLNVLYNQDMQQDGTLTRVRGLLHDGDWLHVGSPEELKLAEEWLKGNLPTL